MIKNIFRALALIGTLALVPALANGQGTLCCYDDVVNTSDVSVVTPMPLGTLARASRHVLLNKTTDQTSLASATDNAISFDAEDSDTDDFHDNVTNNTRITISAGVTEVILFGGVELSEITNDTNIDIRFTKNGAAVAGNGRQRQEGSTQTSTGMVSASSGPLSVVAGDYFEMIERHSSGTYTVSSSDSTYFGAMVIGETTSVYSIDSTVRGARVELTADEALPDAVTTTIDWDQVSGSDPDGFWSAGNPSRLTVSTGVIKVKLGFGGQVPTMTNPIEFIAFISKNGAGVFDGTARVRFQPSNDSTAEWAVWTSEIEVSAGDYFEAEVNQNSDGAEVLSDLPQTWFAIEVVEPRPGGFILATASSTDASVTDVYSLPLASGEAGKINAECNAKKDTNDEAYGMDLSVTGMNVAGTTSIGTATNSTASTVGAPGVTGFAVAADDTNDEIDLRWTGSAAENWAIECRVKPTIQ